MAINPRSPQTFLPSLDRSTGSLPWLNPRILLSRPPKLADYSIFPLRGGAVLLLYPWFDVQPKLPPTERHNCCMVIREGPPCIESAWIGVDCRGRVVPRMVTYHQKSPHRTKIVAVCPVLNEGSWDGTMEENAREFQSTNRDSVYVTIEGPTVVVDNT
mgnify:CR=1 FL=1